MLFFFLVKKLKNQELEPPKDIFGLFNGTSILYPLAYMVIAVVTLVGSVVTLVNCAGEQYAAVYRLIAGLAAISALTLRPEHHRCFHVHPHCDVHRYAPTVLQGKFLEPRHLVVLDRDNHLLPVHACIFVQRRLCV